MAAVSQRMKMFNLPKLQTVSLCRLLMLKSFIIFTVVIKYGHFPILLLFLLLIKMAYLLRGNVLNKYLNEAAINMKDLSLLLSCLSSFEVCVE